MKKLAVQEEKIRRAIRDIVVFDPLISVTKLQGALFDKGFKTNNGTQLDWRYVSKLKTKVNRQTIENTDRTLVVERIAEMKERYRMMLERLWRIIYYTDDLKKEGFMPPSFKDQINAINTIIKLDALVFNAELDAGMFERHLGTLEIEKRSRPLSPELKMAMMKAFINWGIVPKEAIHNDSTHDTTESSETSVVVKS